MPFKTSRLQRENKTLEMMIRLYCKNLHHPSKKLCSECDAIRIYAKQRLEKCPFQQAKTTCAKCLVHCFKKDKREKIRGIMRYSGPKMIYHHPVLTFYHLRDGLRKKPVKSNDYKSDFLK